MFCGIKTQADNNNNFTMTIGMRSRARDSARAKRFSNQRGEVYGIQRVVGRGWRTADTENRRDGRRQRQQQQLL